MIYCVVPEALADELYDKLEKYYSEDPNVKVIIDRRSSERRTPDERRDDHREDSPRREVRDRRRPRVAGEFPPIDAE